MTTDPEGSTHIETWIAPEAFRAIRRAAEIQGVSVGDFLAAAARDAAERTIEGTEPIRLSVDDQRRFADLLTDPPDPSPTLGRAAEAHRRLIQGS